MLNDGKDLAEHLRRLEVALLDPVVRANPVFVAEFLADDFREFGSSGRIFNKVQIMRELQDELPRSITLADFHCEFPAPDVALVTYRSASYGDGGPGNQALRSSLWVYRKDHWQMLFHQGTRLNSV